MGVRNVCERKRVDRGGRVLFDVECPEEHRRINEQRTVRDMLSRAHPYWNYEKDLE